MTVQAFQFALDLTAEQAACVRRQFGGRRYAHNWTVRTLKNDLAAYHATGAESPVPFDDRPAQALEPGQGPRVCGPGYRGDLVAGGGSPTRLLPAAISVASTRRFEHGWSQRSDSYPRATRAPTRGNWPGATSTSIASATADAVPSRRRFARDRRVARASTRARLRPRVVPPNHQPLSSLRDSTITSSG
jgi:hypothetical protein